MALRYWNTYGPPQNFSHLDKVWGIGTATTLLSDLNEISGPEVLITVQPGLVLRASAMSQEDFRARAATSIRARLRVLADAMKVPLIEPEHVSDPLIQAQFFGLAHVYWGGGRNEAIIREFLRASGLAVGSAASADLEKQKVSALLDTWMMSMPQVRGFLGFPSDTAEVRELAAELAGEFCDGVELGRQSAPRVVEIWGKGIEPNPFQPFDRITVGAHLERWGTEAHGWYPTVWDKIYQQWHGAVSMLLEGSRIIVNPIPHQNWSSDAKRRYLRIHAILFRGLQYIARRLGAPEPIWHTDRMLDGSTGSEFWLPEFLPLVDRTLEREVQSVRCPMNQACMVDVVWAVDASSGRQSATKLRWDAATDDVVIEDRTL